MTQAVEAAEPNADLVMFPECSLSGYSTEQAKEIAGRILKDGGIVTV